jgi:predicted PurR-regulated permease PerM
VNYPSLTPGTRWGLSVLVLMGIVFALYLGRAIFVPMTIALLLVAVLWPMANWVNTYITWPGVVSSGTFPWISFRLVKRPLPWGIACMIVIVILVAIIVLVPVGMGMAVNNMLKDVPRDARGLDRMYQQFLARMTQAGLMPPLPQYKLTERAFNELRAQGVSEAVLTQLAPLKEKEFATQDLLVPEVAKLLAKPDAAFFSTPPGPEHLPILAAEAVTLPAMPAVSLGLAQVLIFQRLQDAAALQNLVIDLARYQPTAAEAPVLQGIQEMLNPEKPAFGEMLKNVIGYSTTWLVEGILIMFMLLFLLLEGRLLSKRVVEVFGPSTEAQGKAVKVLDHMAEQVRVYLVWRTIVNCSLTIILGVIYYFMGVKFYWQWALLTGLLCYIPYLGQIVAGLPPFLDALLYAPSPWMAPAVLGIYIVIMTLEGYVIVPLVMGRSLQLNAITVLLACSFWFLVWGVPGLFLAMPLMAAVKAVCAHVPGWEVWANLMSTVEPEPRPIESPLPPAPAPEYSDTEILTPEEAKAHRAALEAMRHERAE